MRLPSILVAFFIAAAWFLSAANGLAAGDPIKVWEKRLERIEARIKSSRMGSLEAKDLRTELITLVQEATDIREKAVEEAKRTQSLLDALGPKPEEKAPDEAAEIKKRRRDLDRQLSLESGRTKQAVLLIARGEQLLSDISKASRERLKARLFQRSVSPLDLQTWQVAVPEITRLFWGAFVEAPRDGWQKIVKSAEKKDAGLQVIIIALVAGFAGWPLRRWLLRRFGRTPTEEEPSYARKLIAGVVEGVARGLIPVLFILAIGFLLAEAQLVTDRLAVVVEALSRNLILFFMAYALVNAGLSPKNAHWRITAFDDEGAGLFTTRLKMVLITYMTFGALRESASWATPSAELENVFSLLFSLALTPLLISLLRERIWSGEALPKEGEDTPPSLGTRLRTLTILGLAVMPLSAAAGFSRLSEFLSMAMVLTGIILGGLWLFRRLLQEGVGTLLDGGYQVGRRIRRSLAVTDEGAASLKFWLNLAGDIFLVAAGSLLLLPVWGLESEEMAALGAKLARGIPIGSFTFSLLDFLIGVALMIGLIVLTRLAQRGLSTRILPNLTRDLGLQDAFKTGFGYVGYTIAALVGLSAMGLNLSNLALIIGALSVGIGFGLQNVVNNFISGLILLVERPIKKGDWVVVGEHQGTVKKINVRSTEVETFQRASVIIPNGDLISSSVVNWTHKNIVGRVEILVGVAYGSPVEKVREILFDCARKHPNVTPYPKTKVLFMNFGESSLDFELRVFIRDILEKAVVASDLRFAIYAALNEAGIEIPFPQRVVHLANDRSPELPDAT